VLSDIRYRKTCDLTSYFVLGVGGGLLPWNLSKFLRCRSSSRVTQGRTFEFKMLLSNTNTNPNKGGMRLWVSNPIWIRIRTHKVFYCVCICIPV
jgi:hypothetical protein